MGKFIAPGNHDFDQKTDSQRSNTEGNVGRCGTAARHLVWAENVSPVPTSDHSEAMPAELKWSLSELARRFSIIEAGKVVPHAVDQRLMRDGLGSPSLVFLASNSRVDGLSDSVKQIAERYPEFRFSSCSGNIGQGIAERNP